MFYYKQLKDGKIVSVEAKSRDTTSPTFQKAKKEEYDTFIDSLPSTELTEPTRDLSAEIDELKTRLDKITKVNGVA